MLSRVANSVYWMHRYIERAENYARFMSVNFNLALDLPPNVNQQWEPLLIATADNFLFDKHYDQPTRENVIHFMTFDKRNPNSIVACLSNARENARTIREVISKEMWEHLNQFYLKMRDTSPKQQWGEVQTQNFFTDIRNDTQLFYGIIDATITRNEAWHFGRLGRFLERADKTSRFLDVKYFTLLPEVEAVGSTLDLMIWSAVLKSVSAYNMHRQQYRSLTPSSIVEFLILDKMFPRAVAHCIRQAELSLYEIAGNTISNGFGNSAERTLSKLRADIEFTETSDIFKAGLHQYLDSFQTRTNEIGTAIFETYFDLKPVEV
ncbi:MULTISPECIES: alpha-E domain-containing protein [Spirosoma]|uniref:Alpha-E domain-containing protein n=1 Tax=Spirosoma liriopis TaxID=2937440 RepID=A0ABT0HH82_9BACT|nr:MULTISPECIES: alpha-E domain-containing protein [Spirosoma]MCK8491227.1 alpha-E domain-containing protein [Spirosoma liriopis]UHG90604.1 alpha-E domain-containing protein [Spirosoma oryzicola]